jgi:hypothetical protein
LQNKANHNSVLLLATLGVYIGLLLVGAPTGVIAQPAAMTRNFDISEEIVTQDDLDKDPELSTEETDTTEDRLNILVNFTSYWSVPKTKAAFTCGQSWFAAPVHSDTFATGLHSEFYNAFARFKPDPNDKNYELTKTLLKRTSLTVADEQVFTVTRLPRSDIDPLFAENAK